MRRPSLLAVAGLFGTAGAFLVGPPISRLPRIASSGTPIRQSSAVIAAPSCILKPSTLPRSIMASRDVAAAAQGAAGDLSTRQRRQKADVLVKSVVGALPFVMLAVLAVCLRPEAAAAAVRAVAQEPARVNKVRALLEQLQAKATGALTPAADVLGAFSWLVGGETLQNAIRRAWTSPLARFSTPPVPGTVLGDALIRLQTYLPHWTPLQVTAFLSVLPFLEARVGVPLGVAMGAPWLKALVVGTVANTAVIPFAAWLGSHAYYKSGATDWERTVETARETYQEMFHEYAQLEGQLSVAGALLEQEETQLRQGLDDAIASLCSGEVLLSQVARDDLVEQVVKGSTILLKLDGSEVHQFKKKLTKQVFENTVGNVLKDSEAFQEVTVAELGQRRVEAAWHPDLVILPEVAQEHTLQHLNDVAAQARVDFVTRAAGVRALREEVDVLAAQVEKARERYRRKGVDVVENTREVLGNVKKFFEKESERKKKLSEREQAALARAEEEAKVQALQAKGKVIIAYGWPKGVINVGVPVPWNGVWAAMYLARSIGMKVVPSAAAAAVGAAVAATIGLGLSVGGTWGAAIYVVALLWRSKQGSPLNSVMRGWRGLMEERRARQDELRAAEEARARKKKNKGGDDPTQRRPA